jgi:hypothetical protein
VADWVTISALATAAGTLALAGATFGSVRSANRAARVAEESLLAGIRPLLVSSRVDDPSQKIGFADDHWLVVAGSCAALEATPEAIYLAGSVRNAASGLAVLHGWRFQPDLTDAASSAAPPVEDFHRLTRDIYVPAGDLGYWQGTFRDPTAAEFGPAATAITARSQVLVDVLYGDQYGGQRVVSRFALMPREDGAWLTTAARHWQLDRPDPR